MLFGRIARLADRSTCPGSKAVGMRLTQLPDQGKENTKEN